MGEQTAIGWCDHTFNAWIGCTEVGPECDHCYARILAARWGWATWGPDTPRRDQSPDYWRKPGSWNRAAIAVGIRRSVFCESMGDLFEDRRDLDVRRLWLWARIETTPDLIWLLLTKRPAKVCRLVPPSWLAAWPSHVWVGTSVGCRTSLRQLDHLRAIPAAGRFVSCEPLLERLGVVDLTGIGWIIVGGESGAGFRPMPADAARDLRDQTKAAGLPFFFKQWGGITPKAGGKLLDGREWCEVPWE